MPFTRPTLQQLITRTEADLAARLGLGQLVPRGFLKAIARTHAGMVHGLYGYIDWQSLQVLPDTGDTATLERWANDLGVPRKSATFAGEVLGNVTLTGTNGVDVDVGVIVQRADGERYSVKTLGTIAAGTVTVPVVALVAGQNGNSLAGAPITLSTPVTGVNAAGVVGPIDIVGGADVETDEELLVRVLQRMQNPPQGGAEADYVRWALEVPGVTRAWCLREHFGIGTVGLTFAVDDDPSGPIPSPAQVALVQAYIDDPTRRPVPATLTVFAPGAVTVNFVFSAITPATAEVKAAVEVALADLIRRDGAPGDPLLISHVREAISNAPGESDYVLTTPAGNTAIAAGSIPVMGTVTWP